MKRLLLSIASTIWMFGVNAQFYSWTPVASTITEDLNDVSIMNGSIAWVVGNNIWKTTDGGLNWTEQVNPAFNELTSILMYSDNNGYACGASGTILQTANGGTSWTSISTGYTCTLSALSGTGYPNIYAVCESSGDIIYTNDGTNFNVIATFSPFPIKDLEFVNSMTGWVIGDDDIFYKTTDGGTSWNTQSSPVINKFLRAIDMIDENTGYIVGEDGTILKTTNGGTNWTAQTSGTTEDLNAVTFLTSMQGWAAGANGTFLKTTDGGSTWTAQLGLSTYNINGLAVVAASAGFAVGDGGRIFHIQNTAQIDENETNQISMYPNPTNGIIHFSETVDCRILGLDGQEIMFDKAVNSVDLQMLSKGIYFYELVVNGTVIQRERIVRN